MGVKNDEESILLVKKNVILQNDLFAEWNYEKTLAETS